MAFCLLFHADGYFYLLIQKEENLLIISDFKKKHPLKLNVLAVCDLGLHCLLTTY